MNRTTLALIIALAVPLVSHAADAPRQRLLADAGWKFIQGDASGAEQPGFADATWQTVNLPHDWSIEGERVRTNAMGGNGGYFPAGVGWYRHSFLAPQSWTGRRVSVEFEGVYMYSDVWINGQHLGLQPYGYTTFSYDLTPYLKPGATNVIAVRVDNSKQVNSRWYSGSGIYRHVWLNVTGPVHVAEWGVFVTTPEISADTARVQVETTVQNDSDTDQTRQLENSILNPSGRTVGTVKLPLQIPAHGQTTVTQLVTVLKPQLWSLETPVLYSAVTKVISDDKAVDETSMSFGIRTITVSAENGFQLNGKTVKICGGCVHHDNGDLGAAAFDRAEERRIELLKAAGFNAIRTSHNPPSPAFLNACDRLGMLVMDEAFDCWEQGKRNADYSNYFKDWWQRDLDAMILRDRNHPAIVMWSIGNEIPDFGSEQGMRDGTLLIDRVRSLDPTRLVTDAVFWYNGIGGANRWQWNDADALMAKLDVVGYNYQTYRYVGDHQRVPERVMVSTESYISDAFTCWAASEDHPYVIGDFVWTALDYIGEAGIGRYYTDDERIIGHGQNNQFPWFGGYCGDVDITGYRKPFSHYRDIVWDRGEKLFMAVVIPQPDGKPFKVAQWGVVPALESWTWPGFEGTNLQVEIYSRCDKVRLYLGNKLIGEMPTTRKEKFKAVFTVPYLPGTLKAVGLIGDREVATQELPTAGKPAKIRLTADRSTINADGEDLSFVTVEVVDSKGRLVPNADSSVQFKLTGPGLIAAIGSADLGSTESFGANPRRVFQGRGQVVIRSSQTGGSLKLTATSPGLEDGTVTVRSRGVK